MKKSVLNIGLLATFIGLNSPVFAQRISFQTDWTINKPLEQYDRNDEGSALIKIANRDFFLRSRLLPKTAAILEGDIKNKKGKILASKGSELIGLKTSSGAIFCVASAKGPDVGRILLLSLSKTRQYCMVDSDSDKIFDFYFRAKGEIKGLPILAGRTPKKTKPVQDVAYSLIDPSKLSVIYFVGIQYRGSANLYNQHVFDTVYGTEEKFGTLTRRITARRNDFPKTIQLLGGKFVVEGSENDSVNVRVYQDFEIGRPFGILRTITYR